MDDRRFSQEELDARRSRGSYEIAASAKPTTQMINGLDYGGAAVRASPLLCGSGYEDTRFRFLAADVRLSLCGEVSGASRVM